MNRAEEYLAGYERPAKNMMNQSVIYGFKARMWLELATRFDSTPDDLNAQVSHEDDANLAQYDKLGIKSAKDCYEKAILYARKAMEGYNPVTQAEWHNKNTGFKFRPGSGNTSNPSIGAAIDIPVIRVEEMYFILAEATAHAQSIASGAKVLEDFNNTYRYSDKSYRIDALANMSEFNEELIFQKR